MDDANDSGTTPRAPRMSAQWIAEHQALDAFRGRAGEAAAAIGLDTEFMRRDTFYPKLALIQVAAGGECALVDPLAFDAAAAMRALLEGGM